MKTFLIDYPTPDGLFSIQLQAASFEDAERKLHAIREHGVVEGELVFSCPAWVPLPVAKWLAGWE